VNISKDEKMVFIALGIALSLSSIILHAKDVLKPDQKIIINKHEEEREFSLKEYTEYLEEKRKININRTDLYQLTRIPGVGVVLASRIIKYQDEHGDIDSREDLLKVKGVGEKKAQKILPFVRFKTYYE